MHNQSHATAPADEHLVLLLCKQLGASFIKDGDCPGCTEQMQNNASNTLILRNKAVLLHYSCIMLSLEIGANTEMEVWVLLKWM